jgi:D-serine dehydratase
VRVDVSAIEDELLDGTVKGVPGHVPPFRLGDVGAWGWNVARGDLPLPVLTLRASALEHNIRLMQAYCDRRGVLLAPHAKTTMAPQVFRRQLEAGAWGLTVATGQQFRVCRRFGVERLIVANQLVAPADARALLTELGAHEGLDCLVFVDSPASVEVLDREARDLRLARPVRALVEVGYEGGRTGVRGRLQLEAVCRAADATEGRVRVAGVAGFEGLLALPGDGEGTDRRGRVVEYLESVAACVDRVLGWGTAEEDLVVTAGGSGAFDLVVEVLGGRWPRSRLVLRSGCYVTHDHGLYERMSPLRASASPAGEGTLRPALELWSAVQSTPERGLAILGFGRRDAPYDSGLPLPLARVRPREGVREPLTGCSVTDLNDQHAYLRTGPETALEVGDLVVCGISHPCTAFDKWRVVFLVDDEDTVVGAVRTFF